MNNEHVPIRKLVWVSMFAIAFAFVESSVVVYLRALYYPEGFTFPLKMMKNDHVIVELCREAATIIMLAAIGIVAGRKGWQRFGYFLIAFGVWDIFYYVWLKVVLRWPGSFTDWDILFLVPLPWIGPVISAVLVALVMTLCGLDIVVRISLHGHFDPPLLSWLSAILGTVAILYSFMYDTNATLTGQHPQPYHYELLIAGLIAYAIAYSLACKPNSTNKLDA